MGYEKKYKEALGWMKKVYPTMTGATKEDAGHHFPELVENEDERIRKALIDYFRHHKIGINIFYGIKGDDIIAWLEKQGTSYAKKDVDGAYVEGVAFAKDELKKQYEANYQTRKDIATFIFNYRGDIKEVSDQETSWKPSDEQLRALNYVVNLMASSESPKENDYYYNVFKDLREQLKELKEE